MSKIPTIKKILYTSILAISGFATILGCGSKKPLTSYSTETLKIIALSENSFVHISYLDTESYGKVACNGLVFINDNEAVVFDTPSDDTTSTELIRWIAEVKKSDVTGVVVNHFHEDCLGGLGAFHKLGIPSFANNTTIALAKTSGVIAPQIGFNGEMELVVGNEKVINRHFGEAHSKDNIVSYVPSEKLLFGGCSIKSLNAKKGYLGDANVDDWGPTVLKIKENYPALETVVPGHGAYGGVELLDYTVSLFSSN
ncbi:subclass B1 metallo-beta-lactamase [Spongiimicrobium sp. 3-5]|uniref:subclass B1 metallo-beta-lactamase n=1 Tax=Spongiimicrobium sp. 3-5 TaxID=3332596 RepID=UPI003980416E